MVFYFMRHARTDANVQQLICGGGWGIPLNDEGVQQAKYAAVRFAEDLNEIKTIRSSPLIKAKQSKLLKFFLSNLASQLLS